MGVFCEFEVNLGRIGREFRVFGGRVEGWGPKREGGMTWRGSRESEARLALACTK